MQIRMNGKVLEIEASISLTEFLRRHGVTQATSRIAVALNEAIAFRAEWHSLTLQDGDRIEIIHAVQGG